MNNIFDYSVPARMVFVINNISNLVYIVNKVELDLKKCFTSDIKELQHSIQP